MDFFDYTQDEEIYIIGIAEKLQNLNSQFIRSGRFENIFTLKIPDEKERELIL